MVKWRMKKLPNNFHQKTIEEKSQYFHSLSDKDVYDLSPSMSFIFYKTNNIEGCLYDGWYYDKVVINKNASTYQQKLICKVVEKYYGFLKWDDILGSQKIVNHIKTL